ncbi:MAG: alkaline phosphatase family protein [Acidobacteriota bacterium]
MSFLKNILKKREPRVVMIGLDGVPQTLLKKLMDKGICPNIKKLVESSKLYQMDASLPEISSVSWASFMTGSNPARHGIFGFTELKPNSYSISFPNYLSLKEKTIWDRIGEKDKKSTILNLPGTYPARDHNGILISGFVAVDLKKSVYPQSLYQKLESMNYKIDVDTTRAKDKDFFYKDLFETLEKRKKVFSELWSEPCDLFIAVITDTDRLQHFEFDAIVDENAERFERAMRFYQKVDEAVGEILDKTNDKDFVMMMSDHGFTQIEEEVYLNRILVQNGFLKWEEDPPSEFGKMAKETIAFAMDPSRIYIHRKGKYPKGSVEEKDVPKIKEDLKNLFISLERNGKKVIKEVFFKEDIYEGDYLDLAPDIVLLSNYGFDLKGNPKAKEPFDKTHFSGMHTRDDAFLITDKEFSKKPHIEDVSKIILEKFNG